MDAQQLAEGIVDTIRMRKVDIGDALGDAFVRTQDDEATLAFFVRRDYFNRSDLEAILENNENRPRLVKDTVNRLFNHPEFPDMKKPYRREADVDSDGNQFLRAPLRNKMVKVLRKTALDDIEPEQPENGGVVLALEGLTNNDGAWEGMEISNATNLSTDSTFYPQDEEEQPRRWKKSIRRLFHRRRHEERVMADSLKRLFANMGIKADDTQTPEEKTDRIIKKYERFRNYIVGKTRKLEGVSDYEVLRIHSDEPTREELEEARRQLHEIYSLVDFESLGNFELVQFIKNLGDLELKKGRVADKLEFQRIRDAINDDVISALDEKPKYHDRKEDGKEVKISSIIPGTIPKDPKSIAEIVRALTSKNITFQNYRKYLERDRRNRFIELTYKVLDGNELDLVETNFMFEALNTIRKSSLDPVREARIVKTHFKRKL